MDKYTEQIESVQEKIRQLKNRQKVLLKKQSDAERKARGRIVLLSAEPFWRAFSPKPYP